MSTNLAGRRVAIYARYSSASQREASLEDQVRRCREHMERLGGVPNESLVFTDAAVSGASLQRAGFEAMMCLVDARRIDAIVTEDLSRVSRDLADAAGIFKRLQYLGVPLLGVADGIDTSAKHGKVTFTIKSLVSDIYLEDLADKTRRGLAGRALAGYSTGGLPYGYHSVPEPDGRGGIVGHRVVVDEPQALVVRRIFTMYLDGHSYAAIAGILNAEGVDPPRSKSRRRRKGWVDSTIRSILHNEAYTGVTSFRAKEWRKLPGTNTRRYRLRPESEVIRRQYPDRRIIDAETWTAVQTRLVAVRAKYARDPMKTKAPGHRTAYPLSGLLVCGLCSASMVISGGSSANYYICGHAKGRRTCQNRVAVREDVARRCILGAIRDQLMTPSAIDHLRRRIAEHLGSAARDANRELEERRGRLHRTEARIAGLVQFISEGDRSEYVVSALRDLEVQAKAEKGGIEDILAQSRSPVRLPTPERVLERAMDLEKVLAGDPVRAREVLRRLFKDGRIVLVPTGGVYEARAEFLPLVAVAHAGGAGAAVSVPLAVRLA